LSSVDAANDTYTATKSGIIKVLALNNSNGDGYYALKNNSITLTSGYSAFVIYCRDYNMYNGTMQTCIVSKGDTLKVEAISNKTVHSATFIPFKLP